VSFAPGASSVNLRGLGENNTLVLIDGQRQVPFPLALNGTSNFVDINSVLLAAVDRIEILRDGASATYGADAIAGVVNIILKDEYNGADLYTHYGITQRGDRAEYRASLTGGSRPNSGMTSQSSASSAPSIITNSIPLSRVIAVFHRILTIPLGVTTTSAQLQVTDFRR